MNSVFRRLALRTTRRNFSTAAKPAGYKPKTERKVWLGDSGAYPVMATILFGLAFTTSVAVWYNARWGSSRKSLFRGEMAKEYQHPPNTHP